MIFSSSNIVVSKTVFCLPIEPFWKLLEHNFIVVLSFSFDVSHYFCRKKRKKSFFILCRNWPFLKSFAQKKWLWEKNQLKIDRQRASECFMKYVLEKNHCTIIWWCWLCFWGSSVVKSEIIIYFLFQGAPLWNPT